MSRSQALAAPANSRSILRTTFAVVTLRRTAWGDPLPVLLAEHAELPRALEMARENLLTAGKTWIECWGSYTHDHGLTEKIVRKL